MESLVEKKIFNGIYEGRKVLITGHTGFKGSWLATWLKMLGADVAGFSYASAENTQHSSLLSLPLNYFQGDIVDKNAIGKALQEFQPEIVFHLAAQALVRKSYRDPVNTYLTNVMGTLHTYEACRLSSSVRVIISITSDKVYENQEKITPYNEGDALGGFDMYSSSKACVELMTRSYRNSFFEKSASKIRLVTARAGNVIGGGDWAEDRLVPDIFRAYQRNEVATIRSPKAIRPWQHVLEPLSGYLLLGQRLLQDEELSGASFNFGPLSDHFVTVEELLQRIKLSEPDFSYNIKENLNAPHEAGILAVDSSLARSTLSWSPVWNVDTAIVRTTNWYKEYIRSGKILTYSDLHDYVHAASDRKIIWTI